MEILAKQATTKGPVDMFTGDVWFDVIAKGEPPSRMRVNAVHFTPGARTAWHSHAVGKDADSRNPATAQSSTCCPATRSTRRPASGIGMAPPRPTS